MKEKIQKISEKIIKTPNKLAIKIGIIIAIFIILGTALLIIKRIIPQFTYKKQLEQFFEAMESEEKLEKYLKKNQIMARSLYAYNEAWNPEDFVDEFKEAKKKDYMDDDFIEEMAEEGELDDNEKWEIKNVSKPRKNKEGDGELGKYLAKMGKIETVKFTIKYSDKERKEFDIYEGYGFFYKGKLLYVEFTDESDSKQLARSLVVIALEELDKGCSNKSYRSRVSEIISQYYDIEDIGEETIIFSEKEEGGYKYKVEIDRDSLRIKSVVIIGTK